jgi:hypothetical protein
MNSGQKLILLAVVLVVASLGCETCKGVKEGVTKGFKKDWEKTQQLDEWINEHLW